MRITFAAIGALSYAIIALQNTKTEEGREAANILSKLLTELKEEMGRHHNVVKEK